LFIDGIRPSKRGMNDEAGTRVPGSSFGHVEVEAFGRENPELPRQVQAQGAGPHGASLPFQLGGVPGSAESSVLVHGFSHDLGDVSLTHNGINANLMPSPRFYGKPEGYRRVGIRAGVCPVDGAGIAELAGKIRSTVGELCLAEVDAAYLTRCAVGLSFDGIPCGPEDFARDAITRAKCEPILVSGDPVGYRFGSLRGNRQVEVSRVDGGSLSVKLTFREAHIDKLAEDLWPALELSRLVRDLVATTLGDADLPTASFRVAGPETRGRPAIARRNSPAWEVIRQAFLEAVA
jgi:hypothetical protein